METLARQVYPIVFNSLEGIAQCLFDLFFIRITGLELGQFLIEVRMEVPHSILCQLPAGVAIEDGREEAVDAVQLFALEPILAWVVSRFDDHVDPPAGRPCRLVVPVRLPDGSGTRTGAPTGHGRSLRGAQGFPPGA